MPPYSGCTPKPSSVGPYVMYGRGHYVRVSTSSPCRTRTRGGRWLLRMCTRPRTNLAVRRRAWDLSPRRERGRVSKSPGRKSECRVVPHEGVRLNRTCFGKIQRSNRCNRFKRKRGGRNDCISTLKLKNNNIGVDVYHGYNSHGLKIPFFKTGSLHVNRF